MHKAQNLRHLLWDSLQPADTNLVIVYDLTALRVGRAVAQHVFQRSSRLRRKPYRGADCDNYGLSLWNNAGQRDFEPAYDSQSRLVKPEAKLRSPEPRDDLALDRVGVDERGSWDHRQHVLRTLARLRIISHMHRLTLLCRLASARYKRGLDRSP